MGIVIGGRLVYTRRGRAMRVKVMLGVEVEVHREWFDVLLR
jgi:hypothetical protein